MFSYNFKYELKTLVRSKWLLILFAVLFIVMLFAGYNGKQKVDKRVADIEKVAKSVEEKDKTMLSVLDSIKKGHNVNMSYWLLPNKPMNIGYSYPRVAAMRPQPLAFISRGQSDLFTHYVQPKAYGDSFLYNYTELANPIQLLFGSFDIAFVIIYILPLLIIAFSYNIFSSEKEYGSLRLIASQPVSIIQWVLHKLSLRFLWLTLLTIITIFITFLVNGYSFSENLAPFLKMLLLVVTYMLFWFSIVLLVNIYINNSAKNAVSLLAIWVMVILIIPAVVGQLSNTIYPVPSRTELIAEVRELREEVTKKQDKILDNFLRDHPEYADHSSTTNYSFWHKYLASQDLIEDEIKPIVNSYETQLEKQQDWIKNWQYVSPAIILQQSFNALAGTSTANYQNYRKQVSGFAKTWRDFFVPMLYKNQDFNANTYTKLPRFNYQSLIASSLTTQLVSLLVFTLFFIGISLLIFQKKLQKGTLINS